MFHYRTNAVDKDMSDPKEIESCLATFTLTRFRRTHGEILGKIRHFIRMYNRFVSFISQTQITYNVESNLVHIQGNYNYNRETMQKTRFRLDRFEHYEAMKEVLDGSAIESVAWGSILGS
ncbi:uncharacterized protein LOC131019437 [Salvia miltiorrhiza]|uniref:uncharacterized protein LOC131019437 n=1 Tax=Salvia miltiorrhiza TaxID=226208 RepID=UPI0025AC8D12|nr:uncharacterized protein LOC131019437 [Salvia miltiorrhiza]